MGSHRNSSSKSLIKSGTLKPKTKHQKSDVSQPVWPSSVEKKRSIKNIFGEKRHLLILDEIKILQSTDKNKLIVFQKIKIEETGLIEFRLGYYMIGVKLGAKGRWVWGQFCLLIPQYDLEIILKEARLKKWFL